MRFFLACALLATVLSSASAQSTGQIDGYVSDSYGNPLIGATVMILGSSMGAMTEGTGYYCITDVPPGTYALVASMIGMTQARRDSVIVAAGAVTTVNFGRGGAVEETPAFPSPVLDEDPYSGRLQGVLGDSAVVIDLPLEHTSVHIEVTGNLQRAIVRQIYGNPCEEPIEAVYTFPLPDNGAVDRMSMYIGDRLVVGRIYEKEEARTIYEESVQEGRTAGLLEQERPNIFTQTVGNILPGDSITIEISYVATVPYDDGRYTLSFPMVIAPRFTPGVPVGISGTGWTPDTDRVPDASHVTPHVVPEGMRTGYDIDLSVSLNTGFPTGQIRSLNHDIDEDRSDNDRIDISLSREDEIPNRDFVLTYTSTSNRIEPAFLASNSEQGGHFLLIFQPDVAPEPGDFVPKEMFFLVDCSGSMSGRPIEAAKEMVRQFIRGMNPDDSFQIMRFSDTSSAMSTVPLENTERNVQRGIEYIDALGGEGGTQMLNGVRTAVGFPENPERMRFVILLTDGQISNEAEILAELRETLGDNTRLFSVGVGSSPNRYLIEGLAEEGRGSAHYIALDEDPVSAVANIYGKINNPYLINIELDDGSLELFDLVPAEVPDLYDGQPIVIAGRFSEPGRGRIHLSGFCGDDYWNESLLIRLPRDEDPDDAIGTLWARRMIHDLERQMYDSRGRSVFSQVLADQITDIALRYGIVSDYTSFVAVSEEIRNVEGVPTLVEVPVNMAEGERYGTIFGSDPGPIAGGLQPSTVGATVISVQEERGLIIHDVTSSMYIVSRDPRVSIRTVTAPVPLDSTQVREAFSLLAAEMTGQYAALIDSLESGEPVPEGLMTFEVGFDELGSVEFVHLVADETGSADLVERIAPILEEAALPGRLERSGRITLVIEFES